MSISARIKKVREISGWKQSSVANALNISQQAYSCLEKGADNAKIETLKNFCDVMNIKLAYLTAEDDQGNGLDVATPTEADSVKLLTVHRSKGLEWDAVFLVGVCETRFPSNRSRTLWTSSPAILPAPLRGDAHDLPQLEGHDKAALDAYRAATRDHDAEEELRLGYVAFTRAAHHLSVSSYLWSPRATPFGPSAYQRVVRDQLEAWGEPVTWLDKPQRGDPNPYDAVDPARAGSSTRPSLS